MKMKKCYLLMLHMLSGDKLYSIINPYARFLSFCVFITTMKCIFSINTISAKLFMNWKLCITFRIKLMPKRMLLYIIMSVSNF